MPEKLSYPFPEHVKANSQTWKDLKAGKIKGLSYKEGDGLKKFLSNSKYKAHKEKLLAKTGKGKKKK